MIPTPRPEASRESHSGLVRDAGLRWRELRLRRSYKPWLVCRRGITRLCIEGYPRSANSYAVRMFRSANDTPIAHHTHSTENIGLAIGYNVPVLALIRDPVAAITSASLYRKKSLDEEFARWVDFYMYIERVLDDVVVADFREVVKDFNSVIGALNSRYGTEFSEVSDITAAETDVFRDIHDFCELRGKGVDQIPVPMTERERAADERRALVREHPRLREARGLYDGITLEASGLRSRYAMSRPG